MKTWLVTGGAGFIGGNFVLEALARGDTRIVNLDALTYAGNRDTLSAVAEDPRHVFVHGDIGDRALVDSLLASSNLGCVDCVAQMAEHSPGVTHVNPKVESRGSRTPPESIARPVTTTAVRG